MGISLQRYEELEEKAERARKAALNLREKYTGFPAQVQSAAIQGGYGYVAGKVEKYFQSRSESVPTVAGLEWEWAWALGGLAVAYGMGGRGGEIGIDVSKALLTIAAYKKGRQ